jgi:hypothetical protein
MNFAWFSSNLPGAVCEIKTSSAPFDVLKPGRAICFKKMFDYAPLDLKTIEKMVLQKPKAIGEIASLLSAIKPGVLEAQLRPSITFKPAVQADGVEVKIKGDPVDFAWSYYLFLLFESVFPQKIASSGKPSKNEVRFAADYDSWMLVKKVDLAKAERKEVLAALSGMFNAANRKLADFSASDCAAFDSFVEQTFAKYPERKNFSRLPQVLQDAVAAESRLAQFASGDKLQALREFFFLKAFERCGFPPFITADQISGVYPELKIPKPRGNFGKKKKKI